MPKRRVVGAKPGNKKTATRQMKKKTKPGPIGASTKAFNAFVAKEKKAGRKLSRAAQNKVLRELQAAERRQAKKRK